MHLFGHNFTGVGTNLDKRLDINEQPLPDSIPVDRVDLGAMHHDIRYHSKDLHDRQMADMYLIDELNAIKNPTLRERLERFIVSTGIRAKLWFGSGLEEPTRKQLAQELHARIVKKFKRMKVFIHSADNTWSADLIELPIDNKMKYCLTVMDGFSKYAWAVPLPNKKSATVVEAFDKVIRTSKRKPKKLWTDSGSEFYNELFEKYLEMKNIILYSTYNEGKCSIIKRFNRTLKEKISHKFTENDNKLWVKMLPKILKEYNSTTHSSIGMTPIEASKPENTTIVEKNLNFETPNLAKPKFKVGDCVRLYKYKKHFAKGYESNWTGEVFKVSEVLKTSPWTYKLQDEKGEVLEGRMYEQELHKSVFKWM